MEVRPPEFIETILRFRHPEVRVVYDYGRKAWVLLRQSPTSGRMSLLKEIPGHLTMDNTVLWLTVSDTINMNGPWAQDRYLEDLDESKRKFDQQKEQALTDAVAETAWHFRRLFKASRGVKVRGVSANAVPVLRR